MKKNKKEISFKTCGGGNTAALSAVIPHQSWQSKVSHYFNFRSLIELKISSVNKASFEKLLQDDVFIDYLNKFLSLPIFGQRIIYRKKQETFTLVSLTYGS